MQNAANMFTREIKQVIAYKYENKMEILQVVS